jgi:hypothetical protein
MDKPTLDQVLEAAKQLSIADQRRLVRLLNLPKPKTIEELAEEQGVKPFNLKEAQAEAAGIWPEDESIDDFLAFLDESRGRDRSRKRE